MYFSGDTGLFPGFSEIGHRYGPFDATLMNIGAYCFAWPDVHMTPEEAMAAHLMIKGRALIPTHWAAFDLAYHDWNEPIERLLKASLETEDINAATQLLTPYPGQPVEIGDSSKIMPPWWRNLFEK